MLIITGEVELNPEHRDEAIQLEIEHSTLSRDEPGCISHNCYLDAEDENRLHFFERWADTAAVQIHFAVPESGAFVQQIGKLAASPPTIEILDANKVEGAPF